MTDREHTIVKLWAQHVPADEIAAVFGCTSATIRDEIRRLRRQGVDIPLRRPGRNQVRRDGPRVGTPYEQMLAGTWPATSTQEIPA